MGYNADVKSIERNITEGFDPNSGSIVERALFNNRLLILVLCLATTVFLGFAATKVRLNADFDAMIPTNQPMIVNFLKHYKDLQSQGNAIRIAVDSNSGSIIDARYLSVLQKINDEVYLLPNVDRSYMTSLWTSNTRWTAVTTDGIANNPVIDASYDGSPQELAIVKQNIERTGRVGELVSDNFRSSMIYVPLLQYDGISGKRLDYAAFANEMNALRSKYDRQGVTLHIVGFGMVMGDMINSISLVLVFFAISAAFAMAMMFWFTRCIRSTLLVFMASFIAVIWQMGILALLGFELTPYSVLVPFLIFAIGMSHGAQKMNGVMQDIGRGAHPLVAARYTFRRLFLAGFAALICDASSFAVLMIIHIEVIRELALLASIGVGILVFTNLIMLPILLSYTGVSRKAAARSLRNEADINGVWIKHPLWDFLTKFTTRRYAMIAVVFAAFISVGGLYVGHNVQVGDLAPGAPELRQGSVYNRDNTSIIEQYSTSSDTLVVMIDTKPNMCLAYPVLSAMDRLEWQLNQMPEVQSTSSLGSLAPELTMMLNEDSEKWYDLPQNQPFISNLWSYTPRSFANFTCTFDPLYISLTDHRAVTLTSTLRKIQAFIDNPLNQSSDFKMSLAGGNAGIEAATNIVIEQANHLMLVLVYVMVILFCFIVFRSWRAVLCAVLPLAVTSILAQALMVCLGIGVKVATLPVIALGVGIGVDYALYVLGIVIKQQRAGASLAEAYRLTLLFTGKIVLFTGLTLAAGVATWIFAPIKFQADMGLLLSFMFLWNMVGAMILLPSLAYFLLPPRVFHQKRNT